MKKIIFALFLLITTAGVAQSNYVDSVSEIINVSTLIIGVNILFFAIGLSNMVCAAVTIPLLFHNKKFEKYVV